MPPGTTPGSRAQGGQADLQRRSWPAARAASPACASRPRRPPTRRGATSPPRGRSSASQRLERWRGRRAPPRSSSRPMPHHCGPMPVKTKTRAGRSRTARPAGRQPPGLAVGSRKASQMRARCSRLECHDGQPVIEVAACAAAAAARRTGRRRPSWPQRQPLPARAPGRAAPPRGLRPDSGTSRRLLARRRRGRRPAGGLRPRRSVGVGAAEPEGVDARQRGSVPSGRPAARGGRAASGRAGEGDAPGWASSKWRLARDLPVAQARGRP